MVASAPGFLPYPLLCPERTGDPDPGMGQWTQKRRSTIERVAIGKGASDSQRKPNAFASRRGCKQVPHLGVRSSFMGWNDHMAMNSNWEPQLWLADMNLGQPLVSISCQLDL